jgi:DNA-binding MarR family transcriptional regulator
MTSLPELGLAVKRLQWTHHRECDRRLARLGVSLVQWDVLRHLNEVPDGSLHDLAVRTFQTDQAMGELARRMVDRGLLSRESGPGRIVRHRLTTAGEATRADGAEIVNSVFAETIGRLTPAERTSLYDLLILATPKS